MFDRLSLKILPLSEREHDLSVAVMRELTAVPRERVCSEIIEVAKRIISAKKRGSSVICMMGAHVLRSGVQRYVIDLMKRGYVSCLTMNGAGIIHDFEFALIGATTESVATYIVDGRFGLWKETGIINDIINEAYAENQEAGMGETIGQAILERDCPFKETSVFAGAVRFGVPATVHVGIGYDIIHQHPNCNGAATGLLSYNDFLKFAAVVQRLEGGIVMNFGSAVMAPEVFLKALSMARNVTHQQGRAIKNFTTLVCDLHKLPKNFRKEPSKKDAFYYFRPWKTMLVRTMTDGGESFYVRGRHDDTIPSLWTAINEEERR